MSKKCEFFIIDEQLNLISYNCCNFLALFAILFLRGGNHLRF